MEYGYVRVSTKEQNEQRQIIALREFGIDEKRIYMDKQSIIREHLAAELTNCTFHDVEYNYAKASFTYTVPALTFNDWF